MQPPNFGTVNENSRLKDFRQSVNDDFATAAVELGKRPVTFLNVTNKAALTGLTTATAGDEAVVVGGTSYKLVGVDPTVIGNWVEITSTSEAAARAAADADTLAAAVADAQSKYQPLDSSTDLSTAFAGQTMWTYGHSYMDEAAGYVTSMANYHTVIIDEELGTNKIKRVMSGSQIEQIVKAVIYGAYAWSPASEGILLFEGLINSIRANGMAGVTSATNTLRAFMAVVTASSRIEHSNPSVFAFGPGWSDSIGQTGAYISNADSKFSTAQGAYVDITLPANPTGIYYLLVIARQATGPTLEVIDVTAGDVVLGTYNLSNAVLPTPPGNVASPSATSAGPYVIRIEAPAGHVVRVTRTDATGIASHVDCLLPQSPSPQLTVLIKEQKLPSYLQGGSDYHNGSDATVEAYWDIVDEMVEEFPRTLAADALPYWNKATCLGSDQTHPNDTGYAALAQGVFDALNDYLNNRAVSREGLDADVQASLEKADNAVLKSSFVAKGDLLIATGSGTFVRLPVGPNGQILTADSSTPTGWKLAAPGGITGDLGGVNISNFKGTQVAKGSGDSLAAGDTGKVIVYNSASDGTLTLPNNIGADSTFTVLQLGVGKLTLSPASGATLLSRQSYTKTAGQGAIVSLYVAANAGGTAAQYILSGDGA